MAVGLPMYGQYGGFGGPSILSRGGNGSGRTGSNPVSFNIFAGASGTYVTNLDQFVATSDGTAINLRDSFGLNGVVGLQGYKSNARSSTSVDLSAVYTWAKASNVSRGLSEALAFTHSRQISRRVVWYFGANGQSTNRSLAFANPQYSPEPTPDLPSPQEEIFDTRTVRANVGTGFTFQKSARLAFSGQGGAFGNERRTKSLIDSRGFMGSGSVQYSLSKRQHIGASLMYGTFYFPGRFGESRYYAPQVFYGVTLSRVWSLNMSAGYYQSHTDRLVSVPLDPFIAELTGQRTALEIFSGDSRGFSGGISLNGNYHRWGMTIGANRGIAPGNGLYLTSERTTFSAGANHTLSRSLSVGVRAGASEMKALTQTIGNARYYYGGTSVSYRLRTNLSVSSSLGLYRTEAAGRMIKNSRFTASAGIYYTPGELPVHIF
ncbi:MAG: hypothetical protein ABI972_15515 [Acidobacteriota bacterium]